MTTLMALHSARHSPRQLSRALLDPSFRAHQVAQVAQHASVDFVRSLWSVTETRLMRHLLPALAHAPAPIERDVFVPRQRHLLISPDSPSILQSAQKTSCDQSHVRVRVFQQRAPSSCELDVVLHAHGGGFVAQSPDSHALYLREWSAQLEGAAIVSVDYSLAPDAPFPEALQQMFDVFLWLRSSSSCAQILGFKVKKIVFCGDSAGGNLACALSLVVAHAQRLLPQLEGPRAVLVFYAPLMLQTRASPSRLMTACDTLLPLGVLLSCLGAYLGDARTEQDFPDDDDGGFVHVDARPWYRRADALKRLHSANSAAAHAFVSPLLCEEEWLPRQVALYLVALHFDACLDDSVQMAKKWKGPVVLDVIDQLPHGFLNFTLLSPEGRRGARLCLDRIQQSLI